MYIYFIRGMYGWERNYLRIFLVLASSYEKPKKTPKIALLGRVKTHHRPVFWVFFYIREDTRK